MRTQAIKNRVKEGFKMNQMNNETYALRRKVINIIYEAKNRGFKLPRIEVRVVNAKATSNVCGYAYLKTNVIHINEDYINDNAERLTHLVLHEIVHAVTGFRHDEKCYLMHPNIPSKANLELAWNRFAHYIK